MTNQEGREWEDIELASELMYTEDGIKRLTLVIRATAKKLNISQNELGRRAGLSTGTMSRYCSTKTKLKRPQESVLRALAPLVFHVLEIRRNVVRFDVSRTYADDWLALAAIATDDFMSRPPEQSLGTLEPPTQQQQQPPTRIMQLLEQAVRLYGSCEACAEYCGLTISEIHQILYERKRPSTVDVGFLSALFKLPDSLLCDLIREDYSQTRPQPISIRSSYLYDLQEQMRTNVFRSST